MATPLPVTGTWLVPFTLYLLNLSSRTSLQRVRKRRAGKAAVTSDADSLHTMVRAHGNFIENVPMAFILAAVAETNGGSATLLNTVLATFFVARVLHAEGMVGATAKTAGPLRLAGVLGTLVSLSTLAGYNGWLVKSYWGW